MVSQICDTGGSFTVRSSAQPYTSGCYRDSIYGYRTLESVGDGYNTLSDYGDGSGSRYYLSFTIGSFYSGQRVQCRTNWFKELGGTGTVAELGDTVGWEYCFYPSSNIDRKYLDHDDITISCGCNGVNLYESDNDDYEGSVQQMIEDNERSGDSSSSKTGAIVGGVLGSISLIAILVGVTVCIKKRRNRINKEYIESAKVRQAVDVVAAQQPV